MVGRLTRLVDSGLQKRPEIGKPDSGWMVGHSEVILGPNFPVVTWTYTGVLGKLLGAFRGAGSQLFERARNNKSLKKITQIICWDPR